MAALSTNFGGVKLTGQDAKTFVRQVDAGKRSDQADKAFARGRELLHQMNKSGIAIVRPTKSRS